MNKNCSNDMTSIHNANDQAQQRRYSTTASDSSLFEFERLMSSMGFRANQEPQINHARRTPS